MIRKAIDVKDLQTSIRTLACLEESNAPVISCYLNLGNSGYRRYLDERSLLVRNSLLPAERQGFEEALSRIRDYIETEPLSGIRGLAVFSRGGIQPFFLPLQFQVPLPNWIVVGSTPNIYHLIELKDTYHRYVVIITTEESARILAVNLGSVTEEIWNSRPEMRYRVGLEWAKEHYQNYKKNRDNLFFKEKIRVLDKLISTGGYTHLILAGNPQNTARMRNALPKRLAAKLIGTVGASGCEPVITIIEATIKSFIEQEERESQAMVDRLQQRIKTNGLAVTGIEESFKALKEGRASMLLLTKSFQPGKGQFCMVCGRVAVDDPNSSPLCSQCGKRLRKADIKEQLISMAVKTRCAIEVVNESDMLTSLGGVGCLLRYHYNV